MSAQSPKETKRQHPPLLQSIHPAAIWQNIQKYLPPYNQATEAPELIPTTQGHKVFNHYFIFKHLFKKNDNKCTLYLVDSKLATTTSAN